MIPRQKRVAASSAEAAFPSIISSLLIW